MYSANPIYRSKGLDGRYIAQPAMNSNAAMPPPRVVKRPSTAQPTMRSAAGSGAAGAGAARAARIYGTGGLDGARKSSVGSGLSGLDAGVSSSSAASGLKKSSSMAKDAFGGSSDDVHRLASASHSESDAVADKPPKLEDHTAESSRGSRDLKDNKPSRREVLAAAKKADAERAERVRLKVGMRIVVTHYPTSYPLATKH
jgi:hypothetical protein